jgi:hypothetical protein
VAARYACAKLVFCVRQQHSRLHLYPGITANTWCIAKGVHIVHSSCYAVRQFCISIYCAGTFALGLCTCCISKGVHTVHRSCYAIRQVWGSTVLDTLRIG